MRHVLATTGGGCVERSRRRRSSGGKPGTVELHLALTASREETTLRLSVGGKFDRAGTGRPERGMRDMTPEEVTGA